MRNKEDKINFLDSLYASPGNIGLIKSLFQKKAKTREKIKQLHNLYKNYLAAEIRDYKNGDLIFEPGAIDLSCFGLFKPARRLTEDEFNQKMLKNKKFAKKWGAK